MLFVLNEFLINYIPTEPIQAFDTWESEGDIGNTTLLAAAQDQTSGPFDPVKIRTSMPWTLDPTCRISVFEQQWVETSKRVDQAKPMDLTQFV
jgi:hypothetical protein